MGVGAIMPGMWLCRKSCEKYKIIFEKSSCWKCRDLHFHERKVTMLR